MLHVRRLPDGSGVVVASVDFPGAVVQAGSYDEAVAILRPRLAAAAGGVDSFDRGSLVADPAAELLRVPVTIPAGKKNPVSLDLDLGVVISPREHRDETAFLVRIPAVPGLEFVTTDRGEIETRVAELAPAAVRRWRPASLLAAQESSDSYLELVEIDLLAGAGGGRNGDGKPTILEERGFDLTARAGDGALGRVDGRDDLVRQILLTLADPERSSVLLVGPHAVGKTALVHEVAARLASGEVPAALEGKTLWRLSANELIAGAQYTGMWQDRARMLIDALRGGTAICFMDDPVPIIDAGRWSQGDNNVSRYLRPYLESGEISIICEATAEALGAAKLKEPSFIEAFHRIEVVEPGLESARAICATSAERLGAAAGLAIRAEAVDAAVELDPALRAVPGVPREGAPSARGERAGEPGGSRRDRARRGHRGFRPEDGTAARAAL